MMNSITLIKMTNTTEGEFLGTFGFSGWDEKTFSITPSQPPRHGSIEEVADSLLWEKAIKYLEARLALPNTTPEDEAEFTKGFNEAVSSQSKNTLQ